MKAPPHDKNKKLPAFPENSGFSPLFKIVVIKMLRFRFPAKSRRKESKTKVALR